MPIYEYVCSECGHEFELFLRSSLVAASGACPQCGSAQIDKRFSTFATNGRGANASVAANSAPSCSGPV
jgi:putative FmdB family regulatory protein